MSGFGLKVLDKLHQTKYKLLEMDEKRAQV